MNQHSPGRRPAVDDIEMLATQQDSLRVQNGDVDALQDDEDADANQALLRTSNSRVPRYLGRKRAFLDKWPQIKGLCVEVRADVLKGHHAAFKWLPERSYTSYDYSQPVIHRKAVGQGVSRCPKHF